MRPLIRFLRATAAAAGGLALLLLAPGGRAQQTPPQGGAAQIFINGQGTQRFAIPDCVPMKADDLSKDVCRTITQVLRADLKFENVNIVPESLYGAIPAMNPDAPNLDDWNSIGAKVLVVTRADVTGEDAVVEVKVHMVDGKQVALSKRYSGRADNPRIFAHQAADDMMAVAGQFRGVARTKIVFTTDRDATKEKRAKELYIVDYDGFNPRRFTVNMSLNILPAWSPDARSLSYVSYRSGSPEIYVASIYEGKSFNLTAGRFGQAFSPAWSPDGKKVAFASNKSGSMEIWVVNADGTDARRLTHGTALNTAPCWSPTGQEIAFTSDRSGSPQIWVMDSEGLNVRRLSTVGNWNDAPAWNPSKQFTEIAYTSRLENGFEVAVVDLATHEVRQITEGRGRCEYPAWAPNGRHLVFSCNRGQQWQLTVSDRVGSEVSTLAAGRGNNVQPDWSP